MKGPPVYPYSRAYTPQTEDPSQPFTCYPPQAAGLRCHVLAGQA
jgi:hypothetical protein